MTLQHFTRRKWLFGVGLTLLAPSIIIAPTPARATTDIAGAMPDLQFTLTRASDGKTVTADDYRGKIVLLFFGYTNCPDICPLTLANLTQVLSKMGNEADEVRLLFVTVDPERDTIGTLKAYQDAFAPQTVALRGTDNQLSVLAKRYRAAYSVTPGQKGEPPTVSHGSGVYAFNREGSVQTLFTGLSNGDADLESVRSGVTELVAGSNCGSLFDWL